MISRASLDEFRHCESTIPLPNFLVANHQTHFFEHESVEEEYRHYHGCSKTPTSRFRCAPVNITARFSISGPPTPTIQATNTIVAFKHCSGQLSRLWSYSDTRMVLYCLTKTTSRNLQETKHQVESRKEAYRSSYHIHRLQVYPVQQCQHSQVGYTGTSQTIQV